jgi:hypothetical protein
MAGAIARIVVIIGKVMLVNNSIGYSITIGISAEV